MTVEGWWEIWPERLEFELEALRSLGLEPVVDERARAVGQIIIRFEHSAGGQSAAFAAVFPYGYPRLPFELYAPDLRLGHHQNPFAGNLCLLARPGEDWRPSDYVARFLVDQLPAVVAAGRATDAGEVDAVEEHQAEPVSVYYEHADGSLVLVDSSWTLPSAASGSLELRAERIDPFRAAVVEIRTAGAAPIVALDQIHARFTAQIRGRWFRVDRPILEATPAGLLAALAALHPDAARPVWTALEQVEIDVIGVVFPEEIGWRTAGDGWVFVVRARRAGSREARRRAGDRRTRVASPAVSLARAGRYGTSDMLARIPVLAPLRDQMISVLGLGGLGAPSALEFARAGIGRLGLLDGDTLEAGNGVRWPAGLTAAGWGKAPAIHDLIRRDWPLTQTRFARWRLGTAVIGEDHEAEALRAVLEGTDLVFDATASLVVQRYLADIARERGVPYIAVWSTNGGWGGVVARIRPNAEACWLCLQLALNDRLLPHPPEDPGARIQPPGCGSPTFTGTSFDLAPVWTAGVRLAVSTLAPDTYGASDWDVGVVSLRNEHGGLIMPTWTIHVLDRHQRCLNHDV